MNRLRAFFQNQPKNSNYSFGLVWATLFALIFGGKLLTSGEVNKLFLALALLFGLLAVIFPKVLYPLNYLWNLIGLCLHRVINPFVMALIYFAVLTPTSFIMKLLGKDFLDRNWNKEATSYWIKREPSGPSRESLKNQF